MMATSATTTMIFMGGGLPRLGSCPV